MLLLLVQDGIGNIHHLNNISFLIFICHCCEFDLYVLFFLVISTFNFIYFLGDVLIVKFYDVMQSTFIVIAYFIFGLESRLLVLKLFVFNHDVAHAVFLDWIEKSQKFEFHKRMVKLERDVFCVRFSLFPFYNISNFLNEIYT